MLTESVNWSGWNKQYGILGSNKAIEDNVKLFPRDAQDFVKELQAKLLKATEKHMEVVVYGDGGFKDPISGIQKLTDPMVQLIQEYLTKFATK